MLGVMPIRNFSGGVPFGSRIGWFQIFEEYLSTLIIILEGKQFGYDGEQISFDTDKDVSDFLSSLGEIRQEDKNTKELYKIIEKGFQEMGQFHMINITEAPLAFRSKKGAGDRNLLEIVKSKVEEYNQKEIEKTSLRVIPYEEAKKSLNDAIDKVYEQEVSVKSIRSYVANLVRDSAPKRLYRERFEEFADILEGDPKNLERYIQSQKDRYSISNMTEIMKYHDNILDFFYDLDDDLSQVPNDFNIIPHPEYLLETESMSDLIFNYLSSLLDKLIFIDDVREYDSISDVYVKSFEEALMKQKAIEKITRRKTPKKRSTFLSKFINPLIQLLLNIRKGARVEEFDIKIAMSFISEYEDAIPKLTDIKRYISIFRRKKKVSNGFIGIPVSRKRVFDLLRISSWRDKQILLSSTLMPMASVISSRSTLYDLKRKLPQESIYRKLNIEMLPDSEVEKYKELMFEEINETKEDIGRGLEMAYREIIENIKKNYTALLESGEESITVQRGALQELMPSYSHIQTIVDAFANSSFTYSIPLNEENFKRKVTAEKERKIEEYADSSFSVNVEGLGKIHPYTVLMMLGIPITGEQENKLKTRIYRAV